MVHFCLFLGVNGAFPYFPRGGTKRTLKRQRGLQIVNKEAHFMLFSCSGLDYKRLDPTLAPGMQQKGDSEPERARAEPSATHPLSPAQESAQSKLVKAKSC